MLQATSWRGRRADITGLICLGARYYSPKEGRFLSHDPLGLDSSSSLYDFANGDPVNLFDPDGRYARSTFNETGKHFVGQWNSAVQGVENVIWDAYQDGSAHLDAKPGDWLGALDAASPTDEIADSYVKTYSHVQENGLGGHWEAVNLSVNPMLNSAIGFGEYEYGIGGSQDNYGRQLSEDERQQSLINSINSGAETVGMVAGPLSSMRRGPDGPDGPNTWTENSYQGDAVTQNYGSWEQLDDAAENSLMDQMSPDEAARYRKYWEKHAPEGSYPYDTYPRYTEDGRLKQVTTYDGFGDRHRQYDLIDHRRPEHQHNFDYDSAHPRPKGTRSDHLPIDE